MWDTLRTSGECIASSFREEAEFAEGSGTSLAADLEFLYRAAKKVQQIREDLGRVGPVIAEQVEEDLLAHAPIERHEPNRLDVGGELDPARARRELEVVDERPDEIRGVDALVVRDGLARIGLGEIEDVVHQALEPDGVAAHALDLEVRVGGQIRPVEQGVERLCH